MRQLLWLPVLLAALRPTSSIDFRDINELVTFLSKTLPGVIHMAEANNSEEDGPSMPIKANKEERELVGRLKQVEYQLDRVAMHSAEAARQAAMLIRTLPQQLRFELQLSELDRLLSKVRVVDEQLQEYIINGWDNETNGWIIERATIEDLAFSIVSHREGSVRAALDRLDDLLQGSFHGSPLLIRLALSMREINSNTCSFQQSPQLVIYNLYSSITLTELKGYAMMQFSWMLLRLYGKGNFTLEAEMMHRTYKERALMKLEAARAAMKFASRHMWQCDPHEHEEGKTYERLTRLLQGHIQNEVDMNSENSCRENCAYYTYAKDPGCFDSRVCNRMPRCAGKLHDCRYIDSDMWICEAEKNSSRRYEGIRYENGQKLGQYHSCQNKREYKVDSWWRWIFWHCSYCFCLCDEQGPNSDRFFNLRPVVADTNNNMVITGMRFTKVKRVIHLQIREGQLEPFGGINASSIRWRPVDNYSITDPKVENGKDYKTLSWEQRAIDLDDLEAPPGHVLTGVRFRPVGTHLNLEIMVSPFNFTSGNLIKPQEQAMWIGNDNTDASDKPRTQLELPNADVPVKSPTGSVPDSHTDQFLLFDHSDLSNDAAQTTIPFLDAQLIEPQPPALLAGAGIYHKGSVGYGGFVAPKLITYDYSKHMKVQFPD
ncbi:uncharacterized protein LOC124605512 isoform X1 [Schistocerca americana]|uniref:uncharacterized protein LOC124605512 isoform X1 n=1 Tax=Schistocerca americana TaxID=7009 RepID=UPI001F4F8719|nr:uncharacterized protein LOC124605512 isoform X1 [Schistocerca americana]XP_049956179.1 uncharacterized protein LOC126473270 isoform X1 [Schistocerca serialis cubense]